MTTNPPPAAPDRSDVAAVYAGRVLLPAVLLVVASVVLARAWYVETSYVRVGPELRLSTDVRLLALTAVVCAVLWGATLWGAVGAGRRLRPQPDQLPAPGARGWSSGAWVLVALLAVYAVALILTMCVWLLLMIAGVAYRDGL